MAERRMFAKSIIDSDGFLELSAPAQLLYFHLGMRADDEGFINKPRSILRMVGGTDAELRELLEKQYLIGFDSGVVVIRHWRVHNYIRPERRKETIYVDEKETLFLEKGGAYTVCPSNGSQVTDSCQTQDRIGKDRVGKDRIDQDRTGKERTDQFNLNQENIGGCEDAEADTGFSPPTEPEVLIYVLRKKYAVDVGRFFDFYNANGWTDGGRKMTDWKKVVDRWQERGW